MAKKMILPQPSREYKQDEERVRNREIELSTKAINEKLEELEARLVAGGL